MSVTPPTSCTTCAHAAGPIVVTRTMRLDGSPLTLVQTITQARDLQDQLAWALDRKDS